eukprot:15453836-Alexandrium_andersonii.AAC.1
MPCANGHAWDGTRHAGARETAYAASDENGHRCLRAGVCHKEMRECALSSLLARLGWMLLVAHHGALQITCKITD